MSQYKDPQLSESTAQPSPLAASWHAVPVPLHPGACTKQLAAGPPAAGRSWLKANRQHPLGCKGCRQPSRHLRQASSPLVWAFLLVEKTERFYTLDPERPTWSFDSRRSPVSFRSRRWPGSESTPPLAPRAWLPLPLLAAGAWW
jgi:hypothetical protein